MQKIVKAASTVTAWIGWAALSASVWAVSPAELRERLSRAEVLTIIDVRSTAEFSRGHIDGAINIPAALCAQRNVPKLGKVVVYGSGLGGNEVETAAAELAKKPGIQVEVLEGGIAAWEGLGGMTTGASGVSSETLHRITYDNLIKAAKHDLVLVDLRRPENSRGAALAGVNPESRLTDLRAEFPGVGITKSPFELMRRQASTTAPAPEPLLVLIDNGDGKAEETARLLKANGRKRVAILAGGEETLARRGKAGLQRQGVGLDPAR